MVQTWTNVSDFSNLLLDCGESIGLWRSDGRDDNDTIVIAVVEIKWQDNNNKMTRKKWSGDIMNNYFRAREQRTLEEVSAYYKLRLYHYTHKSRSLPLYS